MGELDDNSFIKCHECGVLLSPWETFEGKYCKDCGEIVKEAKSHSLIKCKGCNSFFHPSELKDRYCSDCFKKNQNL